MTPEEFWSGWWWPAATAVLGGAFAVLLFRQWLQRRKPHQLAWTVGLLFYAVAAAMEAYSELTGSWDPTVYRIYIVLAASLVGFLGLGSLYLVAKRRFWGDVFLGYILGCLLVFFYGVFSIDLDTAMLVPGITVGGQGLGAAGTFPRTMSLFFNIPGTIFLLGGAIVSVVRFSVKKEYAYRMWANVLIAIGTIIIAAAGSMARAGQTVGLYPAEMVASAVLLAGFLMAGTLEKGTKAIKDRRATEHAAGEAEDAAGDASGDPTPDADSGPGASEE
jgi:hypothetical protein